MKKYKMVFCGTGMIGAGLAANAIIHDMDVTLYDVVTPEKIRENIIKIYRILEKAGAVSKNLLEKFEHVKISTDLKEAVQNADFVQECVPEKIELKRSIYRTIQESAGEQCIICSSTSAIMPSILSEGALYPKSIIVGHPYNPSYLLPLIEVCGPQAEEQTLQKAVQIYEAIGKKAIICRKEIKGFIVNRLSWGAMNAAIESVVGGICSVEDMDNAIMYGPGMRMAVTGQLLTISLGIQGGFRERSAKYGHEPNPDDLIIAEGVDRQIANRPEEIGNTVETVEAWRDKMLAEILEIYKKYHLIA